MFHDIPKPVLDQMKALEETDAKDREDGTSHLSRLRQIPPETGKFLAMLAASAPKGDWLELGTSGGYSALWITQAARVREKKLITFELLVEKAEIAKKTFKKAKVEDLVELVNGDARGHIKNYEEIAFCFLDAEKEMYLEFYDMVVPRLAPGGIFVADNVISHQDDLQEFIDKAEADETVDNVVVPIGKGVLVCRKV
jgi:predicted O-methyltransferase YrrM